MRYCVEHSAWNTAGNIYLPNIIIIEYASLFLHFLTVGGSESVWFPRLRHLSQRPMAGEVWSGLATSSCTQAKKLAFALITLAASADVVSIP